MATKITDKLKKAIIEAAEETDKSFPKKVEKELHKTYKSVITEWYNSYPDPIYQRHYRLYDTFNTNIRDSKIKGSFSTDAIDYGRYTDYIFDLTIMEGWHGGADRGDGHPNMGVPWYRNLQTNTWLRPAVRTFSPYEMMINKVHKQEPIWQKEMKNTLMDNIKRRL